MASRITADLEIPRAFAASARRSLVLRFNLTPILVPVVVFFILFSFKKNNRARKPEQLVALRGFPLLGYSDSEVRFFV